jgi:hypothetical protein
MTLAETILLVGFGVGVYFLFRPLQAALENILARIFAGRGKAKGWIVDAETRKDDKPPQE